MKIDSLQAINGQRPPTPSGESASSGRGKTSPEITRSQPSHTPRHIAVTPESVQSGLGISLVDRTSTPTKSVAAATSAALLYPTPPSASSNISSPPARPKTPLSAHKKLPKPPVSPKPSPLLSTPPPPSIKLQRNETLRSLSESIISSYAKRSPPEDNSRPPPRVRSSVPLQSMISPGLPPPKYATPQIPSTWPGGSSF